VNGVAIAGGANTITLGKGTTTITLNSTGTIGSAAFTAASAYAPAAGSTSILTLGTIGAGTWQGSIIAPSYLGTGTGITTKYLRGDGTWQTVDTGLTVAATAITGGTSGRVLYNNGGVLGEMTTSGSGTVLALTTSPTFVTPDLGTPSAIVLTNASGTLPAGVTIPLGTVTLTGTLPDARLSANVPLLNAANTFTGANVNSTAGAASLPAMRFTGVPFAGTGTTSFPLVYIADANATASTVLSTAGTYFGVNGDGTQDLMHLLKDGASRFRVSSEGHIAAAGTITLANGLHTILGDGTNNLIIRSNSNICRISGNAGVGDDRLVLGAATASYPQFRRSGTGIVVGLADNTDGGSFTCSGTLAVTGNTTLGAGSAIKNIRHGTTNAMVAGVVTVTDTGCTANTRYFFTVKTIGTVTIPSTYYVTTRTASTSFVVTASVLTDTSTLDWMAIEP
jgi:hypothetical protein